MKVSWNPHRTPSNIPHIAASSLFSSSVLFLLQRPRVAFAGILQLFVTLICNSVMLMCATRVVSMFFTLFRSYPGSHFDLFFILSHHIYIFFSQHYLCFLLEADGALFPWAFSYSPAVWSTLKKEAWYVRKIWFIQCFVHPTTSFRVFITGSVPFTPIRNDSKVWGYAFCSLRPRIM